MKTARKSKKAESKTEKKVPLFAKPLEGKKLVVKTGIKAGEASVKLSAG